jgi:hypothetical protein
MIERSSSIHILVASFNGIPAVMETLFYPMIRISL